MSQEKGATASGVQSPEGTGPALWVEGLTWLTLP